MFVSPSRACPFPGCTRPKYVSGGITHDFCGRTHALASARRGEISPVRDPHGSCNMCLLIGCNQQRYYDAVLQRNHDFCCRSHYELAVQRGERERNVSREANVPGARRCSLPGCVTPVATAEDGTSFDYCSRGHASRGTARGLGVVQEPHVERVLVGDQGWKLKLLQRSHPDYENIRSQFLTKWLKVSSTPTLERIFQVNVQDSIFASHMQYREHIAGKLGRHDANVVRRFHGTASKCKVGINVGSRPCSLADCCVCGILTHGFQRNKAGSGFGGQRRQLRYGKGLYSSSTSGKASDYAQDSEFYHAGKTYRTMFLVHVAAGLGYKTRAGELQLTNEPPIDEGTGERYDSVIGETGKDLNYDELVVYDDDAMIPAYFLVYSLR